jgi:sarcosine oxidase subunit beta
MAKRASAVVVGAGIIGASIAYNLSKRLLRPIVVIERTRAGSGSTASALGGFRHQFSSRTNVLLSIESVKILEAFKASMGVDPMIRYDGYLFLSESKKGVEGLKRNLNLQRSLGVPVEFYSGDELQRLFPFYDFRGILGGTLCYRDGHALTSAVHQGYLSHALSLGAELLENTEVTRIVVENSEVKGVETTRGEIETEKVIIAAGAYSGKVGELAGVKIPVYPYPRKILFTRVPPGIPESFPLMVNTDSTLAIGKEPHSIFFSDNRYQAQGFNIDFPREYDEEVSAKAVERFPALGDMPIGYSVSGLYEVTPDSNPVVSECGAEGLYCCAGFAGHGFMHAPAVGILMSELVSGDKPHIDISEFKLNRFANQNLNESLII